MRYLEWARRNLTITQQTGDEALCRCVFHADTSPSMSVNTRKGVYYCYSCHAGGKIQDIADHISETITVAVTDSDLDEIINDLNGISNEEHKRIYAESWLARFTNGDKWWSSRNISTDTQRLFSLGYDSETRSATIPLRSVAGEVIGVIRRRIDPRAVPRYSYPAGLRISQYLFGAWLVRRRRTTSVALTEGSIDAIACWSAGIPSTAMLGSRLSPAQAKTIKSLGVTNLVIMTDNDRAGLKVPDQVREVLSGVSISVGTYEPDWAGSDPADLDAAQIRHMFDNAHPYGLR